MSDVIEFGLDEAAPERAAVLAYQGVPGVEHASARVMALCDEAIGVLKVAATPIGLMAGVERDEFNQIYEGQGRNEKPTPVPGIAARAQRLALFAVTVGDAVSDEIAARFAMDDWAGGAMLDAAASAAADKLAARAERRFHEQLVKEGYDSGDLGVLRYSPGYCGWHITGQRRLFSALRPERVNITLNGSCLMKPVKSVSGVLVAGARRIHMFDNSFEFCGHCEDETCRMRIASVIGDMSRPTPDQ